MIFTPIEILQYYLNLIYLRRQVLLDYHKTLIAHIKELQVVLIVNHNTLPMCEQIVEVLRDGECVCMFPLRLFLNVSCRGYLQTVLIVVNNDAGLEGEVVFDFGEYLVDYCLLVVDVDWLSYNSA